MKGTDQADAPLVVGGRWARRRGLAWLVRAGVVLVPIVAAVAAGVTVSHLLPGATTFWALVGWWAVVLAATLVTQALVQRLARRALPLAALLRLSLVFPDRAPSPGLLEAKAVFAPVAITIDPAGRSIAVRNRHHADYRPQRERD